MHQSEPNACLRLFKSKPCTKPVRTVHRTVSVKVSKKFEDSTATIIATTVENAIAEKPKVDKFITRFAKYYTPAVLVLAILTIIVPPLLGWGSFRMWLSRALVFLVASCPCALVISVPLAFFSGVGAMSKQGVLLKGTKFIEPLANAKIIVCDKTGTITTGELQVSNVEQFSEAYDMRAVTALAEQYSSHPVAQAICRAFGQGDETAEVKEVKEFAVLLGKSAGKGAEK